MSVSPYGNYTLDVLPGQYCLIRVYLPVYNKLYMFILITQCVKLVTNFQSCNCEKLTYYRGFVKRPTYKYDI